MAILAGGKSLTVDEVERVRGRCRIIAINRAWQLAPDADWLFGCDPTRFWAWHPEALAFAGTKIVVRGAQYLSREAWRALERLGQAGVKILRHSGRNYPTPPKHEGASPDPAVVRGNNSLYQLLSVIAHTGANTVLLLGADMRGGHWHGGYAEIGEPNYEHAVIPPFRTLAQPLEQADVAVINCAEHSAIPFWPRRRLEAVLP